MTSSSSSSIPEVEEVEGMIDEMIFLSMKYARIMNDIEFYDRLKNTFAMPSLLGQRSKEKLYDYALAEQQRLSNRLEDIRRTLMDVAYAADSARRGEGEEEGEE